MLISDCAFVDNELLDVVRLFENQPRSISHSFSYTKGVFINRFVVDDEEFIYEERGQVCDEILFKRLERRYAKLALYEILAQKTGEKMPWGALTGIRPTKLAYREKEEGKPFEPLFEKMHVSPENTALIRRVLTAQEGIYEKGKGGVDLFVSLPFCPSKCAYCSFITAPIDKTRGFLPAYLEGLKKELDSLQGEIKNLRSIYIGGGTPFALSTEELRTVLEAVAPLYDGVAEYTVEAGRPDVFTKEKLDLLKAFDVTRICINPQTFDDATLARIGRKHTTEQTLKAFEMVQDYDFSVNLDLIAGLQGEDKETFSKGVEFAAKTLSPDNITVHCLSLKAGAKYKEEGGFDGYGKDVEEMVLASREILGAAGYEPYYCYRQKYQSGNCENVGWTKAGKACVYNVDVMEETADNIAVGANAVSKKVRGDRIERYATPKDIKTYLEKVDEIVKKRAEFFKL